MVLIKRFSIFMMLFFSCLMLLSCESRPVKEVVNTGTEYNNRGFVSLEKLYSIDVTTLISIPRGVSVIDYCSIIDFDENNNMYLLDTGDNLITVFNESGKMIHTFGGTGQGPGEFIRSNGLIVNDEKIYVFEFTQNYKVVNLSGEYITRQNIPWINRLKVDLIDNAFYVFEAKVDKSFTDLEFVLSVKGENFSERRKLLKRKYPFGLKGPSYEFIFANWVLFSKSGEFYFPDDFFNKFSITKYDSAGKPLLRFGREYKVQPYSEEAKNKFFRMYGDKGLDEKKFPVSPPVVRNMILDDRNYLWVISGETYEDNRNLHFQNTIDIFDENGIWLYSFHPEFKSKSFIHNDGKLYVVSPIGEQTDEQFIDVYKIHYMSD